MPHPNDQPDEARKRLDEGLTAFDKRRARPNSLLGGDAGSIGEGYRILAVMIGGVLAGLGLGWTFDYFVHTSPLGLVGGLLIGLVLSIVSAVRSAAQMSARSVKEKGMAPPVPDDDDD